MISYILIGLAFGVGLAIPDYIDKWDALLFEGSK